MSDLSLAIILTGLIVLLVAYGMKRLGKWFGRNRDKFERMKNKN